MPYIVRCISKSEGTSKNTRAAIVYNMQYYYYYPQYLSKTSIQYWWTRQERHYIIWYVMIHYRELSRGKIYSFIVHTANTSQQISSNNKDHMTLGSEHQRNIIHHIYTDWQQHKTNKYTKVLKNHLNTYSKFRIQLLIFLNCISNRANVFCEKDNKYNQTDGLNQNIFNCCKDFLIFKIQGEEISRFWELPCNPKKNSMTI